MRNQLAGAVLSERAIGRMLAEQDVDVLPYGRIVPREFTTPPERFEAIAEAAPLIDDAWVANLSASLLEDAMRAAESVAVAVRQDVKHVRFVNPPCCSRCAVLAGRVYRWSTGFQRHPGCDCSMIPVLTAGPAQNPNDLVERGLVRGLSKADIQAISDGADLNKVVNVRLRSAGLRESGRVIARRGQLTPEGIYRAAATQAEAAELLRAAGYIT